jgi:hypothetical protein
LHHKASFAGGQGEPYRDDLRFRKRRPSPIGKSMKKSLIALTLITLAVSACGKKEEPAVILPPPASTPSLNTTDNPPPAPAVETPPATATTTEPSAAAPAPATDSK